MGNRVQHNQLVDFLEDNFEKMFFEKKISSVKHLKYGIDKQIVGEIDLLVETPKSHYVFEVKSGQNDFLHYKAAKKQLLKHRKFFGFKNKTLQLWYIRGKVGKFTGRQIGGGEYGFGRNT